MNQQVLREFHRLHQYNTQAHQYNTEQSFRQLQNLFTTAQTLPSGYVQPVGYLPQYVPQAQSQPSVTSPITELQESDSESKLKRKASSDMRDDSKKAKSDQARSADEGANDGPSETTEPTVNDKDANLTTNKLKNTGEDTHAVPCKYQSPSVRDASESQQPVNIAIEAQIKTKAAASSSIDSDVIRDPGVLLGREFKAAKTTFNDYGFDIMWLGKNSRYRCGTTRGELNRFKRYEWYTAASFIIYRTVVQVPDNFLWITPGENRNDQKLVKKTSDIMWIYLINRDHWIMVHLALRCWQITYYDSRLGANSDHDMVVWCRQAILDVRTRQREEHVSLPASDPPMSHKSTIQQTDAHSCGPFVLREIEKLIGLSVEDDLQNPLRIRLRHLSTIHQKMKERMICDAPYDPLNDYGIAVQEEKKVQLNTWKTEAVAKAKTCTESSVSPSSASPPYTASPATSKTPATAIPLSSSEAPAEAIPQATTTCSSPELHFSEVRLNDDGPIHTNYPFEKNSLPSMTLCGPSVSEMLGRDTPPPKVPDNSDDNQEDNTINVDAAVPRRHQSRLLRELESTLKVAEEMPMRRTTASYEKYYRVSLPGFEDENEDEDLDTTDDYSYKESGSSTDTDDAVDEDDSEDSDTTQLRSRPQSCSLLQQHLPAPLTSGDHAASTFGGGLESAIFRNFFYGAGR